MIKCLYVKVVYAWDRSSITIVSEGVQDVFLPFFIEGLVTNYGEWGATKWKGGGT